MPNLLLTGPTNNGKSMIIEKFRRSHSPVSHPDREEIPVLVVQMPSDPSVGRFYTALLAATGAPLPARPYRLADLEQLALRILRAADVRVLVIDELHNVLSGRGDRRREFLNLLRYLGNELRIPLVGAGTREAYLAIRADDQLENRFAPFTLPRWEADERLLAAGQLRHVIPAAPPFPHRHQRDGRLPAVPQRRHHRRAGRPAHRGSRRRNRVRRGGHQPAHAAHGGLRRADRAAPPVRARARMTPAPGVRRWPVHPPPGPGEALTSWLARLASLYGMSAGQMLRHNLGEASALLDDPRAADLDFDPPAVILQALAERTGTELGELRLTTIAGWVPWLADTLDPRDGQEAFDTYVRQDSVLLAPGEAGRSTVPRWLPWMPVRDKQWRTDPRACPACAAASGRGTSLLAALPIMTTCGEHGRRLEPEISVRLAAFDHDLVPSPPVPAPVSAMDRLSHEGLTTGMVTLPRRAVHVGVWLRLLRTLLDEVSMAASRVSPRSAATLAAVWDATGRPARAGLSIWRPYERLGSPHQQAMLEAAATAVALAAAGEVTARGTLGPLLTREPHSDVHEGDRQAWEWKQAAAEIDAMTGQARTDPEAARGVLVMFTAGCRTAADFYRERQYLVGLGIPEELLPEHRAAGRTDLRP